MDPAPAAVRTDLGLDAGRVSGVGPSWWDQAAEARSDWDGDGSVDQLIVAGGQASMRFASSSLTVTGLSSSPRAAVRWDVTGDGVVDLVVTGGGRLGVVVGGPPSVPDPDRSIDISAIGAATPGWVAAPVEIANADGSRFAVPGPDGEVRPLWDLDGDRVADVAVYSPAPRSSGPWAYYLGRPCRGWPTDRRVAPAPPRRDQGTVGRAPVIDADAPDPAIVYDNGWYHLYTTNVVTAGGWIRVPHQRSRDLQHWVYVSDALPTLPWWASPVGGYVWAPSVQRFGSSWVMYYTARGRPGAGYASNKMCIGRAVASSPDGPFVDNFVLPLVCQFFDGGSIDPDVYRDADGTPWLMFKNDGNCCGLPVRLWSWRLAPDGRNAIGMPTEILSAGAAWEQGLIEAPSMIDLANRHYLFYSGNRYDSAGYAVGLASCAAPYGPCTKQSVGGPWLGAESVAVGPGGQDPFLDRRDNPWLAYHGWRAAVGGANGGYRALYIDRLDPGSDGPALDPLMPYSTAGPSVPPAPTGLGARPGYGQVTLWWTPPTHDDAALWRQQAVTLRDGAGHSYLYVVDTHARQWVLPFLANGTYTATVSLANDAGYGPESEPVAFTISSAGSRFQTVTPTRLLDTRDGTGGVPAKALGPGQTLRVAVAGRAGLPPPGAVAAVTMNLTATDATAITHLSVWPGDMADPPGTSSLNLGPGQTVAKQVTTTVGVDGTVSIANNSGSTQVIVDLTGWYGAPGDPAGSLFRSTAPVRLLDTRDGTGVSVAGPVGPAVTVRVPITGRFGLPADPSEVRAVVFNLTATEAQATTHIRAWPGGTPPLASSLNVKAGQTTANLVTVGVASDGSISLYNQSGSVQLIADLAGWFGPDGGSVGAVFHPLTPSRVVDTRTGMGLTGPLTAGAVATVALSGHGGLPLFPAAASVVASLTAVVPTEATHVTAFGRPPPPLASTLNLSAGEVRANEAVVATDEGFVSFTTNRGSTDLVVDLVGWYRTVG